MTKIAFLFPGQGSQQAGMGAELLQDPEIAELADCCASAADVDLVHLLTTADDEELTLTTNAQPALLFVGVALARLLARRGIRPDAMAGHSLGEYTALCVAGAVGPEDAVRMVAERGRAMAQASPPGTSSMAAVLGLPAEEVEAALIGLPDVWPANYNMSTQVVIGGTMLGLERASTRLREAGAKRVLPLKVAAAFHTPLMEPAGGVLRSALDAVSWSAPSVPVVANHSAELYRDSEAIPAALERQLSSPVQWSGCVARLVELDCDHFLEVGPKKALSSMMRDLARGTAVYSVPSPQAVDGLDLPA